MSIHSPLDESVFPDQEPVFSYSSRIRMVEIACFSFFVIGFVMRLMHWPGGSLLLILSTLVVSIYYFPFGLYVFGALAKKRPFSSSHIKAAGVSRLLFTLATGFSLATGMLGLLFKIQHYPGAEPLLNFTSILAFVLIFFGLIRRNSNNRNFLDPLLFRLIPILILVGFGSFLG
ncbi:hypothetical protein KFE98_19550 [bacterium SCSIO 12741]|nr:hypothetical protein KFE98_19550 [bacterium SCSIO 12741]